MQIDVNHETQIVTIDGVTMSFAALNCVFNPDEKMLFRFNRVGDVVHVTQHLSLTEFVPGGAIQ